MLQLHPLQLAVKLLTSINYKLMLNVIILWSWSKYAYILVDEAKGQC